MGYSFDILENVQVFLASQNVSGQNAERDLSEIKRSATNWDMANRSIKSKEPLMTYFVVVEPVTKHA